METLADLKDKLLALDEQIKEVKKRLPAHSVKPPIMMELLALEDEYETLSAKISALAKKTGTTDVRSSQSDKNRTDS
jgi:hypothetical protein